MSDWGTDQLYRGLVMSIIPFLPKSSFDPEMTDILTSAFDIAWERVKTSGSPLAADESAATTRESMAKHIIAMAQAGERDKNRLIERAVSQLARAPAGRGASVTDTPAT
jgi:hypothetical protein